MNRFYLAATFSISLVLLLGLQTAAFADSEDGSKSCPQKGDKTDYEKTNLDYKTKHQPDKLTSMSADQLIPDWLKSNAKWWSTGQLNDDEFAAGIKFLMVEEIIILPDSESSKTTTDIQAPGWVKYTAGWWSDGLVSDTEFISGLQHLVNNGII